MDGFEDSGGGDSGKGGYKTRNRVREAKVL